MGCNCDYRSRFKYIKDHPNEFDWIESAGTWTWRPDPGADYERGTRWDDLTLEEAVDKAIAARCS